MAQAYLRLYESVAWKKASRPRLAEVADIRADLSRSGAATLLHTQAVGQSMAHEDAALQAAPL